MKIETKLVNTKCNAPILSIEIKFEDSTKICFSTFYRYGYSDIDMFVDVDKYYKNLAKKYSKLIIIGDLNFPNIKSWDMDTPQSLSEVENKYIELFHDLGVDASINIPTHKGGNILDQLLTNQPGIIRDIKIEPNLICQSDHFSVTFNVHKNVPRKRFIKRKLFNYKKADWEGLNR